MTLAVARLASPAMHGSFGSASSRSKPAKTFVMTLIRLGPSAVGVCAKRPEDSGPGPCFTPVCGRRREKKVVRSQRSMFGLNRGGLTQHSGRRLRGHPSLTVKIDCILR